MKKVLFALGLALLAMDCSSGQQSHANIETETAAAKDAIQQLAGALQTELKSAIQAGGPVSAIGVCNTRAMPVTQKVASEQGLILRRVSLKNRNPANLPNDWQSAVLKGFEQQKTEGRDSSTLAWSEIVEIDGGQEFRFMQAIPTGDVCLLCHGTQLSAEVSQVLAERYPMDRATGYQAGDIRGAFVVTRKLSN